MPSPESAGLEAVGYFRPDVLDFQVHHSLCFYRQEYRIELVSFPRLPVQECFNLTHLANLKEEKLNSVHPVKSDLIWLHLVGFTLCGLLGKAGCWCPSNLGASSESNSALGT